LPQRPLDRELAHGAFVASGCRHPHLPGARCDRLLERNQRGREQLGGVVAVVRRARDPDRASHEDTGGRNLERIAQRRGDGAYPSRDRLAGIGARVAANAQREFAAVQARQDVALGKP